MNIQNIEMQKESAKDISYAIGVDTYNKDCLTYCLVRKNIGGIAEVLLLKKMNNRKDFDEEVGNLAKYFNATVLTF